MESPGFSLWWPDANMRIAEAEDLARFFVGRYSFDDFGALLAAGESTLVFGAAGRASAMAAEGHLGDLEVVVHDAAGDRIGQYSLWDSRVEPGHGAGNWMVTARTQLPPHVEAGKLWRCLRSSEPCRAGEWAAIPVGLREGWIEVAGLRSAERPAPPFAGPPPVATVMEGEHVQDLASFFCAVGEAFRGPGGYFGTSFTTLEECLDEAFRGEQVRLVWKDMAVAEAALDTPVEAVPGARTTLAVILETLTRAKVTVLAR